LNIEIEFVNLRTNLETLRKSKAFASQEDVAYIKKTIEEYNLLATQYDEQLESIEEKVPLDEKHVGIEGLRDFVSKHKPKIKQIISVSDSPRNS